MSTRWPSEDRPDWIGAPTRPGRRLDRPWSYIGFIASREGVGTDTHCRLARRGRSGSLMDVRDRVPTGPWVPDGCAWRGRPQRVVGGRGVRGPTCGHPLGSVVAGGTHGVGCLRRKVRPDSLAWRAFRASVPVV